MSSTALITGASGGIGLELARIAAAQGHALALVARSGDRLRELGARLEREHGVPVSPLAMDLSVEGAAVRVVDWLSEAALPPLRILVNNAGFGMRGPVAGADPAELTSMLRLNVLALAELTRLLLPGMLEGKSGRILNVASTAAFQPGPFMAGYYASKAFVLSLTEALHEELRGTGVTATALCPGLTLTGFQARADLEGVRLLRWGRTQTAEQVARFGWRAMQRGRAVAVSGWTNKLMAAVVRFVPRGLVRRVVRALQGPGARSGEPG